MYKVPQQTYKAFQLDINEDFLIYLKIRCQSIVLIVFRYGGFWIANMVNH